MAKIVVDVEALRRMVDWLSMTAEDMCGTGRSLLRATSDARSYNGQYAPWVQALAGEADHDIRTSADELNDLGQHLGSVAQAFEDADQAELSGDFAWALIMREMVERGEIPTGDWFEWRERIARPPWISPEAWASLSYEDKHALVLEAREAYDAQNERIARMRTPPWEKDPGWLWMVTGINPLLMERGVFWDGREIEAYQAYLEQVKTEYEQHWADFLANQSVYKFGAGDDLTEAFLIYMFGLEGAAEYGVEVYFYDDSRFKGSVVADNQRILQNPLEMIEIYIVGDNAQDLNLGAIEGFEGSYVGIVHKNLCGEITSAVTMGVDPIEALIKFEGVGEGAAILANPAMGTNVVDLIRLYEEYGWEGQPIGYAADPDLWKDYPPTMENLTEYLQEGKAVVTLVNLNTSNGYLEPGDIQTDASHWVAVLQTVETRSGDEFVRIYNPYRNREEWLSYDDFRSSWQLYAKYNRWDERMDPNYRAVIATPPEDLQWLPTP